MIIKEILRKNNIKIKAIKKDEIVFYSSNDSKKAERVLNKSNEYEATLDKNNPESIIVKTVDKRKAKKVDEETVSGDIGGAEPPVVYKKPKKENMFKRLLDSKK